MIKIEIRSKLKEEMINITDMIKKEIKMSGVNEGICYIFVPHTTAAITINENADDDVKSDILMGLKAIVPDIRYRHIEGNSDAHIKASLMGSSVNIMIENGKPILGIWQGIYFCEFDGPRTRNVYIKILPFTEYNV